ncbi:MAG: hypothetical protein V1928_03780 [Parcubacteria group bacterium]
MTKTQKFGIGVGIVAVLVVGAGAFFSAKLMSAKYTDGKVAAVTSRVANNERSALEFAQKMKMTVDDIAASAKSARELVTSADTNSKKAVADVAELKAVIEFLKATDTSLDERMNKTEEKVYDFDKRLTDVTEVVKKLSTTPPAVVAKPEPTKNAPAALAKAKPVVKKAPTKVAKKPAAVAKKPVKKITKKVIKKSAKVVKAKTVKLDAGAKTVITVGPNKDGQMEVTLDIFK